MIRVLIADPHAIARKGLVRILTEDFDPTIIDEAGSGEEVLQKAGKNNYDLVLLGISMPGGEGEGLDVLKKLKSRSPELQVLVFSHLPDEHRAVRALCAGAAGYVTNRSSAYEWVGAIHAVLTGGIYVSKTVAKKLATGLTGAAEKPLHGALSNREHQLMKMDASGKTIRAIAKELSLSVGAVSSYRARLLRRLRMKSNTELILYAFRTTRSFDGQKLPLPA